MRLSAYDDGNVGVMIIIMMLIMIAVIKEGGVVLYAFVYNLNFFILIYTESEFIKALKCKFKSIN